ncbi:MAG: glycerol-3-phosphate dehydrogenase, partial [Acidobacteria bacterium]|nr:glycerol-3-phosphate dehydrogenase [Acidobacteriota bacterium]
MRVVLIGPVAVLGAGSWGTALAIHLARCGREVRLWGRDAELVGQMEARRHNAVYLPGVELPRSVHLTPALESAVDGAVYVVAAVPSHGARQVLRRAADHLRPNATVVSAAKGIEDGTLLRVSEVIAQEVGDERAVTVLSGPSFAAEVARGVPTAVAVAGRRPQAVNAVQQDFRSDRFRLYASDDVVGVE